MKITLTLILSIGVLLTSCVKPLDEKIDIIKAGDGVTDIDSNYYGTTVIGHQEWMTDNLKTTRFCNGDTIPVVDNDTAFALLDSGEIFWLYYDFDPSYNEPFGKLYNWNVVNDERNVCPCGWRVPTQTDFENLERNIFRMYSVEEYGKVVNAPGNIQDGSGYWAEENNFTNETMLSFIPGGRFVNGGSFRIYETGNYWLSAMNDSIYNNGFFSPNFYGINIKIPVYDNNAYSIRCMREF